MFNTLFSRSRHSSRRLSRGVLFLSAISLFSSAPGAEQPRIGLVLSGGGARGSAHIGVLKVLEELRIPVHAIAGTSMGSLVGGAYASGVSLTAMERQITGMDWNELFTDDPERRLWPARRKQAAERPTWNFSIGHRDGEFRLPKGAIAGQKVQLFFANLAKNSEQTKSFDRFPIPFRAVATNLENGQMKVFDSGSLAEAMRASMSVPGLFAPLETEQGIYVDGGLVRNLPVDVTRKMGVDVVIAVNLGTSYLQRDKLGTVLGVTGQMITILTEQNVQRSLQELDLQRDVLIAPQLGEITAADFDRASEAIALGEEATRELASQLRRYSVSESDYRVWHQARLQEAYPLNKVDEVLITGIERVNPALFQPLKDKYEGENLDRSALEHDLGVLYGRGDFEQISYNLSSQEGRNVLVVDAVEKSWGPDYLSFGVGFLSDNRGDTRFSLRGIYNQTWVNKLGGEWLTELSLGNEPRLFSEFYQPFRLDRAGFVAPYLDLNKTPLSVFVEDERTARYDVRRSRLGVDLGTTLGTTLELRLGAYSGSTRYELDTGSLLLSEGSVKDSGIRAMLLTDTLDSSYLPTSGNRFALSVRRPLTDFGADFEYTRGSVSWRGAISHGANTFIANLKGGITSGDQMPYYDQFPLGGFLKLSGYANEQFRGDRMAYGNIIYYRRVTTLPSPIGRGLYLGGSLEIGRHWNVATSNDSEILNAEKTRYGSSLFLGLDSFVGPFYLGIGLSGEGDHTLYTQLGIPWDMAD
jgi:NTE family protein